MIFVHDKGRMANNMLQYGHVYAWGREHGRRTVSMRFAYKYPWFRICHTRYHHFLTYVFAKYAAKWGLIPTVRFDEEGADYSHEEELMMKRRLVVVGGWWARWYDLFLKYKPEIVDLFAFDEQVRRNVEGVFRGTRSEEGGTRSEEGAEAWGAYPSGRLSAMAWGEVLFYRRAVSLCHTPVPDPPSGSAGAGLYLRQRSQPSS